ncbi:MAG: T9SS type A sorting domain-containing protein [Bacteroidales bacterium]
MHTDVTCSGASDGTAEVTGVIEGTPPFIYDWSRNHETTAKITGLAEGIYSVTVTDLNGHGCPGTKSVEIKLSMTTLQTSLSSTPESCDNKKDGTASVSVSGGTAPYTYSWLNGGTTAGISGLSEGTYSVVVTDANGCHGSGSVVVTKTYDAFPVSITSSKDVFCSGGSDGSATASASGGLEPYSYEWANGATGVTAVGLKAGTYRVIATDANGCHGNAYATIGEPSKLILNISPSNSSIPFCSGTTPPETTLTATASGGTPPYNYNWPGGSITASSKKTTYCCKVTDANGCTAEQCVSIVFIAIDCPRDPNLIAGPAGYAEEQWISVDDQLSYTTWFENDPEFATAPAQEVRIIVPLTEQVDKHSLRVGNFGFGDFVFSVPSNTSFYTKRLDVTDSLGVYVDVIAGLDVVNNEAFWIFQSIDPATGLPPNDPQTGFLPVNDSITHTGEGFVTFTMQPKSSDITGDSIQAKAEIIFDINEPINTNQWFNVVDAVPPTSIIDPLLSVINSTTFDISFNGSDDPGGCGISNYQLYFSKDAGSFNLFGEYNLGEVAHFTLMDNSTYGFFSVAADNVGNKEAMKSLPDTTIIFDGTLVFAGADATICSGDNYVLSFAASNAASFIWSGGDGVFDNQNILNPTYSPGTIDIANGQVELCLNSTTSSGNILKSDCMNLFIEALPEVTCPANMSVCLNASPFTLTGGVPATGTFSGTGVNNGTFYPATAGVGIHTITYSYTNLSGCENNCTFTITVKPSPTVNPIANKTFCNGVTVPATTISGPVAGTTFTWTNSNTSNGLVASGSGNIPTFVATNTTNSPIYGTITITPTANGCIGTVSTFIITVYPTPIVNSIANKTFCNGVVVPVTTLSGPVTGNTYTWANSNTSIGLAASGSGNVPSFTATNATNTPISGTISITPTANGCTGTVSTFTITVYPTPTVNAIANKTSCTGVAVPITTISGTVAGTTFTWTNSNTSIGLAASGSGNIPSFTATNTTNSPISGTITITPTANGCTGTVSTFTITVYPTPIVNSIANKTFCNGVVVPVTTLSGPVTGNTYTWANSNTSIGLAASGSGNVPSFTATNATNTPISGIITITPAANGCTGTVSTFTITIYPNPTVNAGTDALICQSETAQLAGTVQNQSSVLWTTSGDGTFSLTNSLTPVYTPGTTDVSAGTAALTLTASPISPCLVSASDSKILTIQKTPVANAGLDATINQGNMHQLSGSVQNNTSVLWTTSGNGTFSSTSSLTPVYTPGTTDISVGTVTLTLTAGAISPCTVSASNSMILTIQKFVVDATANPNPICFGGSSQLFAVVTVGPGGPYSFSWISNPAGFTSNEQIPSVNPGQTTKYILTVTNGQYLAKDSVVLNVTNQAVANAGIDASICQGSTHQLAGTVLHQSSFLWTTLGNGTFSSTNSLTPVYTPGTNDISAGTATLTLTASPISPCTVSASDTTILISQKIPTVDAGSDQTVCSNDLIILNAQASNYATIQWTATVGSGAFSNPTSVTTHYTPSSNDITRGYVNLTFTANSIMPCATVVSDVVKIILLPGPTATAPSTKTICENQTASLTATATNKSSTLWTTAGDGTFNNPAALAIVYTPGPNDKLNGAVMLTFSAFPIAPCSTPAIKQTALTIKRIPIPDAGNTNYICRNNTSLQLNGSVTSPATTLWSTLGDGFFSNGNILNPLYAPGTNDKATGQFRLVLKANATIPCNTTLYNTDTLLVTFIDNPTAQILTQNNQQICQTPALQLNATASSFSQILWTTSGDGTFDNAALPNAKYTAGTADASNGSAVKLTMLVSAIIPCTLNLQPFIFVTFKPGPIVNAGVDATVCIGGVHQLSGTAQHQNSYVWETSGDGTFSSTTILNPVYTPGAFDITFGAVTLALTTSAISPCTFSASDMIILYISNPEVLNNLIDQDLNLGEELLLSFSLQNASPGIYSWYHNGFLIENENMYQLSVQNVSPSDAGEYFAVFTNDCEEVKSDTVLIKIFEITSMQIQLDQGWSGISSYLQPNNPDMYAVFAPVINKVIIVADQFDVFWPSQNINTLADWSVAKGYKVKMNTADTLIISGKIQYPSSSFSIPDDWSYLPVNSVCPVNIAEIFMSLQSVTLIKEIAGSRVYWPEQQVYSLQWLVPGEAYEILNANGNAIQINYPECDALKTGVITRSLPGFESLLGLVPWKLSKSTPSSHTIAVPSSVLIKTKIETGDILAAFDEIGNCFGITEWNNQNTTITIFGDDPLTDEKDGFAENDLIKLRVYNPESKKEADLLVTWETSLPQHDGLFHTNGLSAFKEFEIGATGYQSLNSDGILIYPNPAKDELNIIVPELDGQVIKITNINGQQVYSGKVLYRQTKIDISQFRKGVYFVQILSEKCNYVQKVVTD